ncbi:pyruvate flavodoxin/ferredoxin oxidoreductase [Desulfococcus multivorans]|uniref:Pyruvate flavodoxin/ferredoxin oxidoreductase domain protein n=1 Tax=Desulfococcus multivorans DSM 2059 TaxID=1121405 RepID=S7TXK3_DESML|nr:pyruvate flavodoxin/ferredoxin oxidoreductase [Desulfococcus multivorans]AOY58628.1 PorA: pyruvate synthase, subunit alpha [Desulfococcus multivorans]AQV00924.1 pyruvate ferredoxin oxidoreductase [Desulfococcus multivorans]EPR41520.1 pyruvate flavodoxin/ferredoxin oxidoreductase domain protein [Desulfococcus multivorans DSM 2059]SJZ45072.1 pyruvate ferredoxin oxidoreductase alpha subunit [Desulfococcus multivorans DSM 2059]
MKEVVEGSHAVSEAVRLARVQVMSAYPITPQTHIVEALSEYCAQGRMAGRFICVESEHSAMAAVIGAASGGARTFTATSSHGLALMHELLHWASAARLPIVMAEVNRALGPGWNIWMDQTDSLAQRDTGWIQLYCEDGQEALDTTLLAFRLAESADLPVMVVLDAFFLSHTYEPVDIPDQATADRFLPAYRPRIQLDTREPCALSQMAPPGCYMEMRYDIQAGMRRVPDLYTTAENDFEDIFGRRYGMLEAYRCEDAEIILAMAGTAVSTSRQVVDDLRDRGEKVGLLKIRMFRPFPTDLLRRLVGNAQKIAVLDRNFCFGLGGIFAQEIRAALYHGERQPSVFSYISGLGGRDVTPEIIEEIYRRSKSADHPEIESVWVGLDPGICPV